MKAQSLLLRSADFPTHTIELLNLFNRVNETRVALNKAMKGHPMPFQLPEYKAANVAYRAYWRAVDADRTTTKA